MSEMKQFIYQPKDVQLVGNKYILAYIYCTENISNSERVSLRMDN
jgi:hypothetical protein